MEENPPTTDKVIITTITQDEKHTTATDGSDGETSTARSNLVAAAIWQNMKKKDSKYLPSKPQVFYLKIL